MMSGGRIFDLSSLSEDNHRLRTPFSLDIAAVNDALGGRADEGFLNSALLDWIRDHQPCVFASYAASAGALTIAIVTSEDMARGLRFVADKVEKARRRWLREAYEGGSFGLIVVFTGKEIILASPDAALMLLATRLVSIFARRAVDQDEVVLQPVFLRHESDASLAYCWDCPVNLFAVQGDRRWWHHRRMPGGLALSVNSVGHMMKAQAIAAGIDASEINRRGLDWALRTIRRASRSEYGSGVQLLGRSDGVAATCPDPAASRLDQFRDDAYLASFDTDVAVPSGFFSPRHSAWSGRLKRIAFTSDFIRCPDGRTSLDWTDDANREAGGARLVASESLVGAF